MIIQTGIFNAVRTTNCIKCVWYWLLEYSYYSSTAPRNCHRGISVLYLFTKSLWVVHIWKLHQFHINNKLYCCCNPTQKSSRMKSLGETARTQKIFTIEKTRLDWVDQLRWQNSSPSSSRNWCSTSNTNKVCAAYRPGQRLPCKVQVNESVPLEPGQRLEQ